MRFKSVCGNTLKILDTFFGERWNTVEVRTTKKVLRTGFERHHSANGPGDMGCRVIAYDSDLENILQQHFSTGPNHLLKMALELPNHPEDELFLN